MRAALNKHPSDVAGTPPGSRTARAERAYEYLRLALLEGDLLPGDKLSVVELTAQLDCSRVPVMEAMKRLAAEDLIDIVPQVGCQVATPTAAQVTDFFKLFAAVEKTVTALAAARRSDTDVSEFREVCAEVDRLMRQAGGPESRDPLYRRANLLFHSCIHRMAHSPTATRIAASLWDRSDFYIKLAFGSLYFSTQIKRSHRAIRRAIIAGDADSAGETIAAQLEAVGTRVAAKIAGNSQT